jgi:hypothetical protein
VPTELRLFVQENISVVFNGLTLKVYDVPMPEAKMSKRYKYNMSVEVRVKG